MSADAALRVVLNVREAAAAQQLRARLAAAEAELRRWRRGGLLPVVGQHYELLFSGLDRYHLQYERPILKFLGDAYVEADTPDDPEALPSQNYIPFDKDTHKDSARGLLFTTAVETFDEQQGRTVYVRVTTLFPTSLTHDLQAVDWNAVAGRPYIDADGAIARLTPAVSAS